VTNSRLALHVFALCVLANVVTGAQNEAKKEAGSFNPPRAADGHPDFSGMWEPGAARPLEKAREEWHPPASTRGNGAAYTFFPPGDSLPGGRSAERGPMIFDPPDGVIPLQPWALAKRAEIIAHQEKVEYLDPRVLCLQAGVPRANMPVSYNSYQILQTPEAVTILYEWNHMTRVIPLDGRPHLPPSIQLANGDSRGHWDGDVLVVDVTNFNDELWPVGHGAPPEGAPATALTGGHGVIQSDQLHVTERYWMTDANTIRYEARLEDPKVYTQPWKLAFDAFKRGKPDHQLFEYACHEGNSRNIKLQTGIDIEK
jgi:hypothetical protein